MKTIIKGFKVFNPDWTCRGFKYEVGQIYEHEGIIELCGQGFHFCIKAVDCFDYYSFDRNNKVAEVEAIGLVESDSSKSVTNKIRIVRELNWHEVLELVNAGKNCTGHRNSGDWNSGDWNSGHRNSGHRNSGDWNSGYGNSGDWNSGDWNSGHRNSGHRNSGDGNSGDWNSGDGNSGDWNSGDWNSGDWNSGDWNSGDWNSGDGNSGHRNSGDWNSGYGNSGDWNSGDGNSGHRNSGHRNSGYGNSGDWNSGDWNSGVFCTEEPKIKIFDVQSDMTLREWRETEAAKILRWNFEQNVWIYSENMTAEEKEQNPSHETTGGYLRTFSFKEACKNMWNDLTDREKEVIKNIPNFNKEKFEEIAGIGVK